MHKIIRNIYVTIIALLTWPLLIAMIPVIAIICAYKLAMDICKEFVLERKLKR